MKLKEEIGTVLYDYGSGLYANITNRCPCQCEFCVRSMMDGLGSADSLWLKREPTTAEFMKMLKEWDTTSYKELVFCGYGEPMERLETLLDIAKQVHETTNLKIRINTNGLGDLIQGAPTAPLLSETIDAVSVSLNQCSAEKYNELCHPKFGEAAFPALLDFTRQVQSYVPHVAMSVVNVIPQDDIVRCQKIADKLGVPLKIRG